MIDVILFGSSFHYLTAIPQKQNLLADFQVLIVLNLNADGTRVFRAANKKMAIKSLTSLLPALTCIS